MSRLLRVFAFLLVAASAFGGPDPDSFCGTVLDIYQRGDVKAYLALIETAPSTPALVLDQSRSTFQHEATVHPVAARMEKLTGTVPGPYERDGVWYIPTLTPVSRVVVTFDDPSPKAKVSSVTLFVGIKNGRYRIITAMKKPPLSHARSFQRITDEDPTICSDFVDIPRRRARRRLLEKRGDLRSAASDEGRHHLAVRRAGAEPAIL